MLLLVYLLLSAQGQKSDENMLKALVDTMADCTDIIDAVDDFIDSHLTPDDQRRLTRDEAEAKESSLVDLISAKLGTCKSVIEAVDEFNKKYSALMEPEEEDGNETNDTLKDPIILNVGGEHFSTSLATLRAKTGTYLEKMFRKEADTVSSPDGSYFIDREPSTFEYVLEYLRTDDMLVKSGDESVRMQVLGDAEYFQLPEDLQLYLRWSSLRDGLDLSFSEFSFLNKELKDVSKEVGGLLYQASKDGQSASTFHSRCDSKGATVVIIETTEGNMFGGFTDAAWSSSTAYVSSSNAFLFQLRPATKRYSKKSGSSNAIYRHKSYGPIFGSGHDLLIADNCMSYATSYTRGIYSYDVPTDAELNGGARYFRVKDYVVVQAESL